MQPARPSPVRARSVAQRVQHYLAILETTLLATVGRPYFGGGATEIKSQPKVYGFDTGFVAYFKEWDSLRDPDRGLLLEHLVLGELCARFDLRRRPGSISSWSASRGPGPVPRGRGSRSCRSSGRREADR